MKVWPIAVALLALSSAAFAFNQPSDLRGITTVRVTVFDFRSPG